jgi:hypothetical protein
VAGSPALADAVVAVIVHRALIRRLKALVLPAVDHSAIDDGKPDG